MYELFEIKIILATSYTVWAFGSAECLYANTISFRKRNISSYQKKLHCAYKCLNADCQLVTTGTAGRIFWALSRWYVHLSCLATSLFPKKKLLRRLCTSLYTSRILPPKYWQSWNTITQLHTVTLTVLMPSWGFFCHCYILWFFRDTSTYCRHWCEVWSSRDSEDSSRDSLVCDAV